MHWLYPFEQHWFSRDGLRLHYLDEGPREAPPLVMVHGNPTWSFYYRNMVHALRGEYRCIVPDHIGMGLSDKPGDERYAYTLKSRVDDLEELLAHLNVTRHVTLVVHDWGGMIAMAWAARHMEAVRRLVVFNTAAFRLPPGKPLPRSLWWTRNTPLGALAVRGFNAFARGAAKYCVTRRPMSAEVRQQYLAPYNSWANRIATLRFVQDIPLSPGDPAYATVQQAEEALPRFADRPTLICWGGRDFVFDDDYLKQWKQYFPAAQVHRLEDAGHYVLEDAPENVVPIVRDFLHRTDAACGFTSPA